MGANNLQKLRPDAALRLGKQMKATIDSVTPNDFGASEVQIANLGSSLTELAFRDTAVVATKAAYHEAVNERRVALGAAQDAIASIARTAFGMPRVTPAMIDSLGLSPHSTSKARLRPIAPAKLNVAILPTTELAIGWSRQGNPQGTTFVVESQTGTGPWLTAGITTKAKLVLSGYPAGTAVNFRVSAVRDAATSAASPVATAYADAASAPALRLAA